jgi:hypothetical protein
VPAEFEVLLAVLAGQTAAQLDEFLGDLVFILI